MIQGFLDAIPHITGWTFLVCLTALPALAIFRGTRPAAAFGYITASFIFGVALWITSALLTYSQFGWIGVLIGVMILGIGVFPIALIVLVMHSAWGWLGGMLFLFALVWTARGIAIFLHAKSSG